MYKYFRLLCATCFMRVLHAQEAQLGKEREIALYQAVVKCARETVTGILQQVTPEAVTIQTYDGAKTIPATAIKSVKVKFDKKKNVPIFRDIAQAGLDAIVDPAYTSTRQNLTLNPYGQPMIHEDSEEDTPLASRLLFGGAIVAGAVLGNEVAKIIPPATIETFRIRYSQARYQDIYEELSMYSVYLQSSADYEQILKEKLKRAMQNNKLQI